MIFETNKPHDQERALVYLLLLFNLVYLGCAIFMQTNKVALLSKSGSPLDYFNGSVLMVISVVAILIASQRPSNLLKLILWLGISAAAGAIAIDEWFEYHEKTRHTEGSLFAFGDDDYVKIVLWFCAGFGIFILYKLEELSGKILVIFLVGFSLQSVYLVIDMGDGDFFKLPFAELLLLWVEEILELLAMQSYLVAILLFHHRLYVADKGN